MRYESMAIHALCGRRPLYTEAKSSNEKMKIVLSVGKREHGDFSLLAKEFVRGMLSVAMGR